MSSTTYAGTIIKIRSTKKSESVGGSRTISPEKSRQNPPGTKTAESREKPIRIKINQSYEIIGKYS
ncbi:hypothetical protein TcasGA2_TC001788 [Tribolium castaneum]|uniref:Uncharacterized protein n=1 Tax=Tribolium castaneum TaxID=7070 RepID=D7EKV8_TRICA|nr:hypothetical protein TcasGA2_TC001788 [Tribolium castaneum]